MNRVLTRPRLLVVGPLPPGLTAALAERYEPHPLWQEDDRAGFLARAAGSFAGGVTMSRHGGDAAVMGALAGGVLACFGVGFDGIDLAAAARHRVAVSITPDVLTDCVADLAMGLVIAAARRLTAGDRFVQSGRWEAGAFPLTQRVSGKRLGLVGFGRIGQAIARRAGGFDMPVRYHTRRPLAGHEADHAPDLLELARWCDVLVLACPGGAATRHLISAAVLDALGPDGILVNVARGSVVDEDALATALAAGRLGAAGLDVFTDEPRVPAALRNRDNVVLMPHAAATTRETRAAMEALVLENLASFFATGRVRTPPPASAA